MFHVGDIVRKLREQRGLDQRELARLADNMSTTTLSEIERGVGNQRRDTIERVATALGRTADELYAMVHAANRGAADTVEVEDAVVDVSGHKPDDIPVIAEGEASPQGTLFWDSEGRLKSEVERRISRPRDVTDPHAYGVLVRGDSMTPRYLPGELLIVVPRATVKSGAFAYIELLSGERLIKRVHRQTGGWNLESLNTAYPPRFVTDAEIGSIHKIAYGRSL